MADRHLHALPHGYEFDGYRIERVLGAGGFGITYKAVETMIGRGVAIKEFLPSSIAARAAGGTTVHPLAAGDGDMFRWGLKRFRNEARTLVSFHHPNIVAVYRYFEANGTAYLVMAFEEGASLAEILKKARTLTESEIHGFLDPLLDGVAEVHKAGFLHRDIKPANIVIRANGKPVLIDFGAARQALGAKSQSSQAIVSPGYAPFEQYTIASEQGPYTDIYALGATLYCCISGKRPVESPDRVAGMAMPSAAEIGGRRYSAALLHAIDHALEVKGKDRPQSVDAWRAELAALPPAVSDSTLTPARGAAPPPAPVVAAVAAPRRPTRRVVQVGGLALAAGVLAAGGYTLVRLNDEDERARAEADAKRRAEAAAEEQRRKKRAEAEAEEQRRLAPARQRAEAAAQKGREAQAKAQIVAAMALSARQMALAAADCARKAAAQARQGTAGHSAFRGDNGDYYEGQVNAARYAHGCGITIKADKTRVEARMIQGYANGGVVMVFADGARFEGTFKPETNETFGVWQTANGTEYQAKFVESRAAGPGIMSDKNGTRYEGDLVGGEWRGHGVVRDKAGVVFEGEFANNTGHGLGVLTGPSGEKTYGRFEKGQYKGPE